MPFATAVIFFLLFILVFIEMWFVFVFCTNNHLRTHFHVLCTNTVNIKSLLSVNTLSNEIYPDCNYFLTPTNHFVAIESTYSFHFLFTIYVCEKNS